MNWRFDLRAVIGILIGIGLIVLVLVLIFTGGPAPTPKPQVLYLPNYINSGSYAEMTESGPIIAPQNHQSVSITVSSTNATLNIYNGYEGQLVSTNNFPMDQAAYSNFIYALQRLGYTSGNNSSSFNNDEGYCPTGTLFVFTFNTGNEQAERYWITTCGDGNFEGQAESIRDLFRAEIPNYDDLTQTLDNL